MKNQRFTPSDCKDKNWTKHSDRQKVYLLHPQIILHLFKVYRLASQKTKLSAMRWPMRFHSILICFHRVGEDGKRRLYIPCRHTSAICQWELISQIRVSRDKLRTNRLNLDFTAGETTYLCFVRSTVENLTSNIHISAKLSSLNCVYTTTILKLEENSVQCAGDVKWSHLLLPISLQPEILNLWSFKI